MNTITISSDNNTNTIFTNLNDFNTKFDLRKISFRLNEIAINCFNETSQEAIRYYETVKSSGEMFELFKRFVVVIAGNESVKNKFAPQIKNAEIFLENAITTSDIISFNASVRMASEMISSIASMI